MQRLMRAAYPDAGPGAAGGAGDEGMGAAPEAPGLPVGDGGGGEMPQWLREAGDAGFARPQSPAHYKIEYAPNVEIDAAFDRMAREWMYQAELPAGWSSEIARDYQRRAAKLPEEAAQTSASRPLLHPELGQCSPHFA